jgi:hypothetical protein
MSGVQVLQKIFGELGKEIRLVGGVVRDLLRGITPKDIDLAGTRCHRDLPWLHSDSLLKHWGLDLSGVCLYAVSLNGREWVCIRS